MGVDWREEEAELEVKRDSLYDERVNDPFQRY